MTTTTLPFAAVIDITRAATAPSDALAAFDALAAGEALLVRTAGRPEAALAALRHRRPGAYEWTPLAEGPWYWEVEIHRRPGRPGALRCVTEAMNWDHARLDALEQVAMESSAAGDRRAGARLHLRFVFGLLRHIRFEETVLFPEFERISGIRPHAGPTALMRVEHRAIASLLEDVETAAKREACVAEPLRAGLRALLHQHDSKEETVVYTVLDRALSARESDELVFRFQAMDPER